jgi:uncharacterized protein (DUF1015 family)
MVRVKPFKAYRYNKAKIDDFSKVISPPYDIIKGNKIDEYQSLSKYNISWIIKNKLQESDTESENQYTRASSILKEWMADDVLIPEGKDSFYVYGQNFKVNGNDLFRFGFIGLIELQQFATDVLSMEGFSGVLQHEETLPKDIQDRLNLSRNCMAQFGLIFVIYPDHEGQVDKVLEDNMKKEPVIDVIDGEGIRHRIWQIEDETDTRKISHTMKEKYVIIADGHHRYKTALALSKENPELESAKYRMLAFVNMSNPGLVILPTHRLIHNLEDFSKSKLLEKLEDYFEISIYNDKDKMFQHMGTKFNENKHSFGLFMDDNKFYALTLKDEEIMDDLLPEKSKDLRKLDVAILHSLILDRMLGIDKKKLAEGTITGGGYVSYIKGIGDAVDESIKSVKGESQAVFFMNPTRIDEVEAVSKNFEVMPQKSTFFYPKVYTGFTINKLE